MPPRALAQQQKVDHGHAARILREKALIDGVFEALRPPDDVADLGQPPAQPQTQPGLSAQRRRATDQQPCLSLEELLFRPDYQDSIAKHIISRATLYNLLCTCKRLRDALWRDQMAISFLGLFRTEFGEENSCRLVPHQRRSLRHMIAAEAPPNWTFGQLRGGILADDPGLGKTVTMLALIVYSVGSRPTMPAEFWGTSAGWQALRLNPEARRALLPLLNHLRRKWAPIGAHPAFCALQRFQDKGPQADDEYPTLESCEAELRGCLDVAVAGDAAAHPDALPYGKHGRAAWTKGLLEPVRVGLNRIRAGLDPRQRSFFQSLLGRRALFERSLLAAATTLVVVPEALLEHWFEQLRRHVDLRCLERHGHAHTAVWIDGVGDMANVREFRLKSAANMDDVADEYTLASYAIVLTTYERCAREQSRSHCQYEGPPHPHPSPLMRLRWLRLVVDEGHELGKHELEPANLFIASLPAERRWVMSGTPTVDGEGTAGAEGALMQLHRLLAFLREPSYGVEPSSGHAGGEALWRREVAAALTRDPAAVRARLTALLQPLMVRHTKADLQLPEPTRLPLWEAWLPRGADEHQIAYTGRVCDHAAQHVVEVMEAARLAHRHARADAAGGSAAHVPDAVPQPKAVVFSEFENDLEQVTSRLVHRLGNEAVAQHWGDFRSTELARFRNGRATYRACPRCAFHNEVQVRGDLCERRLIEVTLLPHEAPDPHAPGSAEPSAEVRAATWPVEEERVFVSDPLAPGGWRQWATQDYERYRHWAAMGGQARQVWVAVAPLAGSSLPTPVWPTAEAPPLGGPGHACVPAVLKGWARCGSWRGPPRYQGSACLYHGCPPCWAQRGMQYAEEATHRILQGVPWQQKQLDSFLLMLCQDGSLGLDLAFVTHLFILNPILDAALERQVVSRAHRMGATGPVIVETVLLWKD